MVSGMHNMYTTVLYMSLSMSVLPVMCLLFIVCLEVRPSFGSLFHWRALFLWLIVVVLAVVAGVVAVFYSPWLPCPQLPCPGCITSS